MKTNRLIVITLIVLSLTITISCDSAIPIIDAITVQQPKTLADSRFNGTFTFFYQWEDSWGIEEDYEYTSFKFDGTNKVYYFTKYYSYYNSLGWTHSGDFIGDYYSWYFELQIGNGLYRVKLWDNIYSDWTDWEPYAFSSDGKTLTFFNWYNISGYNKVVTK